MGLSLHPGFRKVKLSHNFVVIAICICPNFKMYLSKLHKCICLNCRQDVICVCQNFKYFCPNCQIYLFNLKIWTNSNLNFKMYLFKLQNVFAQIAKCICLNCKMYSETGCIYVLGKRKRERAITLVFCGLPPDLWQLRGSQKILSNRNLSTNYFTMMRC